MMGPDSERQHQAYQLFMQEALEVSQQLAVGLQDFYQTPSLAQLASLVQAAQMIRSGATQLHLVELDGLAHHLEVTLQSLQKDPVNLKPQDQDLLQQAYAALQRSLSLHLSLTPSPTPDSFNPVGLSTLDSLQESFIAPSFNLKAEELTLKEWDIAGAQSNFPIDILGSLERLERLATDPESPELKIALQREMSLWLSWGENLDLDGWFTIAQATLTLLEESPTNTQAVAQLVLAGARAVYQLAIIEETTSTRQYRQKPTVDPFDLSAFQVQPRPERLHDAAQLPMVTTDPQFGLGQQLPTTKLFVWQTEAVIYTLPSDWVTEIILPRPDQLIPDEHSWRLRWHHQMIPVYQLTHPLNLNLRPEKLLRRAELSRFDVGSQTTTVLVIHSGDAQKVAIGDHLLALAIDIETLITEPELIIQSALDDPKLPSYCYGYTLRSGGDRVVVVQVMELVHQALAPNLAAKLSEVTIQAVEVPGETQALGPVHPRQESVQTVMVVDDSRTLRHILARTLKKAGYEVMQAQDGREALSQLQQKDETVHLVICDIEMPNMNGFEFLRCCRRNPKYAHLPVVMLSTFSSSAHRDLAHEIGASAYVVKPYDEAQLLATIRTLTDVKT